MDEEDDISLTNILTEYLTYVLIAVIIVFVVIHFFIYPGIFMGRFKSNVPSFYIDTKDGAKIEGMLLEPPEPENAKNTILYFHGNSGNMGNTMHILSPLCEKTNSYILSIDYRGFGMSYGFPSESGLINDAESIFERILNDSKFVGTKKIVYGHSLGGAVALGLAEKRSDEIDSLILENTFTSIKDVVNTKYTKYIQYVPDFAIDMLLCTNSWDSRERIKKLKNIDNILFISSMKDMIIDSSHMDELYKLCSIKKKDIYKLEEGNHNNVYTTDPILFIKNISKVLD